MARTRSTALVEGSYTVQFLDLADRYLTEWYDNAYVEESATPVVVAAREAVVGIDAQLSEGGSISGRVTDETGNPLAGVHVTLGSPGSSEAFTDADGSYQLRPLAAGSYRVRFEGEPGYFVEWFDDAPDEASATPVVVARDQAVSGIDAQLFDGAAISGTVTDEDGNPLGGITVSARGPTRRSATTGPNGFYRLAGLTTGSYIVRFEDSADGYVAEYFDDADRKRKATPIELHDGEVVSGVDAQLGPAGSISGTVVDKSGRAVAGVVLTLYSASGRRYGSETSAGDGSFVFEATELTAGNYTLYVRDPARRYRSGWYGGAWVPLYARHLTIGRAELFSFDPPEQVDVEFVVERRHHWQWQWHGIGIGTGIGIASDRSGVGLPRGCCPHPLPHLSTSYRRKRDVVLSARTLPPVWHVGQ